MKYQKQNQNQKQTHWLNSDQISKIKAYRKSKNQAGMLIHTENGVFVGFKFLSKDAIRIFKSNK